MPKPRKKQTRKDSATLPQPAPTIPRTRLFWVSFDDPDDEESAEVIKTPEQICQEALTDTIETLLNEQTASPSGPPVNSTAAPPASSRRPSPDTLPTPAGQTSIQSDLLPQQQHSVDSNAQPDATHAAAPPVPLPKPRRQRKRPTASKATAPAQTQPPATIQRVRVRRDLKWPGDNSSSPSGS